MGGVSSNKQGGDSVAWLSALKQQGSRARRAPRGARIDLYRLVRNSCAALQAVTGAGVEVQVTAPEDLGRVKGHPSQLRQVLMSLALNAAQAMDGQGTLRIYLTNQDPESGPDTGELRAPDAPTDHVLLEVADHGRGMDPDAVARAFEPGFTTKAGGNGLGLFLVRDVVRRHGGVVHTESAPGAGTTVLVYLPRAG